MPKAMERRLKAEAKDKGFGKKRSGAYVYGTMRKVGWRPSQENTKDKDIRRDAAHKAAAMFGEKRGQR